MSSLDKMLLVLDIFSDTQSSIQLEDVVKATGASRATSYRYIQTLSKAGILSSTTGGRYVLGARVIELERLVRRSDPLLVAARPLIRRTSNRLKVNVMLCSYYGDTVMCSDLAWADDSIEEIYERGRPMPMFRGAMAKIILANLTPYQLRNIMLWHAGKLREAGLGENWDEFRATMAHIRKSGYCVTAGEVFENLVGIAAPVFNSDRRVLGSVVLITSEERYRSPLVEQYTQEVVGLSEEINQAVAEQTQSDSMAQPRPARPRKVISD